MIELNDTVGIPGAGPVSGPALGSVCQSLGKVLNDGIDVHRCQAAKALGRIGASAAVQPLIKALLDEDEDVRTDAAEALLELADPEAGKQLFENLLGDPCTEVKLAAIRTLAKLQDKQIVPWLRRMVKGRDEEITWDEQEFYASGWDDWVEIQIVAIAALAQLDVTEAVPDIVEAIRDENAQDMTEAAFKALAQLGSPGIEALAGFLNEKTVRPRRRAAAALAALDSKEAQGPLAQAFSDPSAEVRLAAMRVRAVKYPDDVQMVAMLEDPDTAVRAEAVQLIGRYHKDRLIALLDDPTVKVQTAVLSVLAGIKDFDADEQLIEGLRKRIDSSAAAISIAAASALAAIAPEVALDELIPLLKDSGRPVEIRLGALSGLIAVGGEQVMAALVAVMDDAERQIRLETMSALARLAQADAVWPNIAGTALLSALQGEYDPAPDDAPDDTDGDAGEDQTLANAEDSQEEIEEPKSNGADTDQSLVDSQEPQQEIEEPELDIAVIEADANKAFPTSTVDSILEEVPAVAQVVGLPEKGIELSSIDMERLAIAKGVVGKKRMAIVPKVVVHDDIRCFAARVLGDLERQDVAMELADTLAATDVETGLAAADSLARIGASIGTFPAEIADKLIAAMANAERDMKLLLIRALAACDGEDVVELLEAQLSEQNSGIRSESIRALSRIGKVDSKIEALLNDPDPSVRMNAAAAVAQAAKPGAVNLLTAFALSFEGRHRRQVARLLIDLDQTLASEIFVKVLGEPEQKSNWSAAIEALEELNRPRAIPGFENADQAIIG